MSIANDALDKLKGNKLLTNIGKKTAFSKTGQGFKGFSSNMDKPAEVVTKRTFDTYA